MSYSNPLDVKAQEREQKERDDHDRLERENVLGDVRWLLESKRGRRVFRRWMEFTGVDRSSFHTSGSVMSFNEGMRNVGLKMIDQALQADPKLYTTMLEEFAKT